MIKADVTPSGVRKYLYEYCLIALSGCVVYLFLALSSTNRFIRDELMRQRMDVIKTIEANNYAINSFLDFQKREIKKERLPVEY